MARDQDLPANPMKISGACGRLMCCLKYEHPIYQDAHENWPHVGDEVETPEGPGRVRAVSVPGEKLVVKLAADGRTTVCPVASTCGSRAAYDSRADVPGPAPDSA
jgi:cell fate regulator YaaT (PSP1 superfamily)